MHLMPESSVENCSFPEKWRRKSKIERDVVTAKRYVPAKQEELPIRKQINKPNRAEIMKENIKELWSKILFEKR